MTVYSVRDCRYYYDRTSAEGGRPALNIDEAEFEEGRTHVFLGPNGSGKTTLLKLFNNLLIPEKGTVFFKTLPVEKNPEIRQKTVYVHQNPLLLTGTVFDNIAYGLRVRGVARAEIAARVAETLTVVGLEGYERRRSGALSGGEQQRTAIARALILRPEVLLLDEPTSSVDRESVQRMEHILLRIKEELGCTIFISTHDLPFAYRICDNLVHMDNGSIQPSCENILRGGTEEKDFSYSQFISKGVEISCPHMDGNFSTAVLGYDEIIISKESVISSARNNVYGRVCGVVPAKGTTGQVDVEVAVGGNDGGSDTADEKLHLYSRVTEQAVRELGLAIGTQVYLAFKASSVRLY